jgi:hypothetical protein
VVEERIWWPRAEDDIEQDLSRRGSTAAPHFANFPEFVNQLAYPLIAGTPQTSALGFHTELPIDLGNRYVGIVQIDEHLDEGRRYAGREDRHRSHCRSSARTEA